MLSTIINEIMFVLIGALIAIHAIRTYANKDNPKRVTSGLFWLILSIIFVVPNISVLWGGTEPVIPYSVVGVLVIVLALLSLCKSVQPKVYKARKASVKAVGNKIFIPAIAIGILSFLIYFIQDILVKQEIIGKTYALGSIGSLGVAIGIAMITALAITGAKTSEAVEEGTRLLDLVGPMSILPQLLAALGSIFTIAGVGTYISGAVGGVISQENQLIGVVVYCISMAVFTIIMGNGFAAFSVITAGIGVPFVIAQGGNPAVVGALGLTAGYCGTLLTPMAANFNIVPANILEMKDNWGIIKAQAPVACIMLILHIILMYTLAF